MVKSTAKVYNCKLLPHLTTRNEEQFHILLNYFDACFINHYLCIYN